MGRLTVRASSTRVFTSVTVIMLLSVVVMAASLLEVIESDDVPGIEKKLASGTDPNLRYEGIPIILIAASHNGWGVVRTLLNAGANPNDTVPYTRATPLYMAAKEGKLSIVKLLVEKGAEIDFQIRAIVHVDSNMYAGSDSGNTALTIAVVKGKKDVALYLLSKGADPNKSVVYENAPIKTYFNLYGNELPFILRGGVNGITHKSGTALQIAKELRNRDWLAAAVDSMKAASGKP